MPRQARPQPTRCHPPLPRNPPECLARCAPATRAATPPRGRAGPTRRPCPTAFTHHYLGPSRHCGDAARAPVQLQASKDPTPRRRIAKQEFMRFAPCLNVKPREAPKSSLLGASPRALDPGDLCALCASALKPFCFAGLPAEPERELAARLRVRANSPSPDPASPESTVPFESSRTDPLNREPKANSATAPFKPSRIDPLNREPGTFSDPGPRPVHRVHEPAQSANPRHAPHTPSQRRRQEIFAADECG
jgi:hypothetical protein